MLLTQSQLTNQANLKITINKKVYLNFEFFGTLFRKITTVRSDGKTLNENHLYQIFQTFCRKKNNLYLWAPKNYDVKLRFEENLYLSAPPMCGPSVLTVKKLEPFSTTSVRALKTRNCAKKHGSFHNDGLQKLVPFCNTYVRIFPSLSPVFAMKCSLKIFFIQNVKKTSKNFPLDTSNDPIRLVFLFSETYLDNSAALYFCLNPESGVIGT